MATPAYHGVGDVHYAEQEVHLPIADEDHTASGRPAASWSSTLFNLTNTAIGAGTLALPYTLRECGLLLGTLLIVTVGWLSWFGLYARRHQLHFILTCIYSPFAIRHSFTSHFLNLSGEITGDRSFIAIARSAYGKRGERAVSVFLFLLLMGPLSAYFNIAGSYIRDTIVTFDHEESHQHEWYTQQVLIMLIMGGGVMFPLSCLKSLRSIAFASLLALFAMAYAVVLILYSFARDATAEGWQWPHIYVFYKPSWSIVSSFAMIGMAYVNHAVLVESTAEMHRPTPARKFTLIAVSSSLVTVIYVLVSVCGYLHHGNAVDQNILNSEPKDALFASARIAVAFVVSLSYPLVCAPARLCLDWLVAESYRRDVPRVGDGAALLVAVSDDGGVEDGSNDSLPMASYVNASVETERWRWIRTRVLHAASWDWHDPTIASWRFYAETVFITVMSLFIAIMIPGLDKIFALFGAMSGSLVVYILPALFYRSIALKSGVLLGSGLFPCRKNTGTPRSRRRRRTTPAMAVFGAAVHGKDDDRDHLLGGDLYEEDSVAGGIDIDGNPAATPPTFLTLVMVYVNCMVGVLLFGIGTSFALADLFIHETDKP